MKKLSLIKLSVAAAMSVAVLGTSAVKADSVTATANAAIATALVLTEGTQMSFGKVAAGASAGSVLLAAAGGTTDTNVTRLSGVTAAAGAFTLAGENSATYAVTLPASTSLTGPGTAMTVNAFTDNASGSLDGSGAGAFNIGATLAVGASQAAGTYSGSYSVTVNYN